jgi:predicted polyphosphate/ATP-dependent NAD kinase
MQCVGIVANPASGKDVRRLVARASVFDNQEKQAIVIRALAGIFSVRGSNSLQIRYLNDGHGIVRTALASLAPCLQQQHCAVVDAHTASAADTTAAARALQDLNVPVVLTLGGDGTNRAFALGWQAAPLIAISTGTNNVFPMLVEATVAGAAAGLIASGAVAASEVATQQKVITVEIENEAPDLALIDAVMVAERFIGARALLAPEQLRVAVLTRADPAAVGITAIGGLINPVGRDDDAGLQIDFGEGSTVLAPIAPGLYRPIGVTGHHKLALEEPVVVKGPGVLAFDGERERVLRPGQCATLTISRTGPLLLDIESTLHLAVSRGCFLADEQEPAKCLPKSI